MATIHFHETTTSTPEQFVAALTDFGPGRSKIFGRSADDNLVVHDQGPGYADVTEGSGGIWERLHYDWSDPDRVVLKTTDSNTWGGDSGHTYTFTRQPNGTPTWTSSSCATARTSRGTWSGSCSGSLANASSARSSPRPSRRSKPGTQERARKKVRHPSDAPEDQS